MVLPGRVTTATSGSLGFDTNTTLSLTTAKQFQNQGYKYAIRYLSLGSSEASGDLTANEANDILKAGLALMPVQHVRFPGWTPSGSLGTTDGQNAGKHAAEVGFPKGVTVWMDLEGVNSSASAQSVIDYANKWYDAVSGAGYTPGIYVGANSKLTSSQLYNNLKFQNYWKSGSNVPDVAQRGYEMVQATPLDITVNGIKIDKDSIKTDNKGGLPKWLTA